MLSKYIETRECFLTKALSLKLTAILLFSISFSSCYIERGIEGTPIILKEADRLYSITESDGKEYRVPTKGMTLINNTIKNDTIIFEESSKGDRIDENIIRIYIPLDNINTIKILPEEARRSYMSVGPGVGLGFIFSLGYTYTGYITGVHIGYTGMIYGAEDRPDNYTGLFINDNLNILSFMFCVGGKPSDKTDVHFGFEAGPSYVNYKKEVYEPNPNYDPSYLIFRKYFRSEDIYNSFGLSLRMKMDIKLSRNVGMQFSAFSNINANKSMVGVCFLITIGR